MHQICSITFEFRETCYVHSFHWRPAHDHEHHIIGKETLHHSRYTVKGECPLAVLSSRYTVKTGVYYLHECGVYITRTDVYTPDVTLTPTRDACNQYTEDYVGRVRFIHYAYKVPKRVINGENCVYAACFLVLIA